MNRQIFYCNDDNPKKIKIIFSSGLLDDDTWLLCHNCNKKAEFQRHRISEIVLDSGEQCD